MDAIVIYHQLRSIAEPIHEYNEQLFAFAKWIESSFDFNPSRANKHYEPIKTEQP